MATDCGCGFVGCKFWDLFFYSEELTNKAIDWEEKHGAVNADYEYVAELAHHAKLEAGKQCERQMRYTEWRKDMLRAMAATRPSFEKAIAEGIAQIPAVRAARKTALVLSAGPVKVAARMMAQCSTGAA
jgi:hypothetical protein